MEYIEILSSNPFYFLGFTLLLISYLMIFHDQYIIQGIFTKATVFTSGSLFVIGCFLIFFGNNFEKQYINNAEKVSLIKLVEESDSLEAKNYLKQYIDNDIKFEQFRIIKKTLNSIILNDKNKIYKKMIEQKIMEEPIDATN